MAESAELRDLLRKVTEILDFQNLFVQKGMSYIKTVGKFGAKNSSGIVYLPKEFIGKQVKILLMPCDEFGAYQEPDLEELAPPQAPRDIDPAPFGVKIKKEETPIVKRKNLLEVPDDASKTNL